jgi:hypothetical protein
MNGKLIGKPAKEEVTVSIEAAPPGKYKADSPTECAGACSINACSPDIKASVVYPRQTIILYKTGLSVVYWNSPELRSLIELNDAGKALPAMSFRLLPMPKRLAKKDRRPRTQADRKYDRLRKRLSRAGKAKMVFTSREAAFQQARRNAS